MSKNAPLTETDESVYPHAEIARLAAWLTYADPARRPQLVVQEHRFDLSIWPEPDGWLGRVLSRQISFSPSSEPLKRFVYGVVCSDINNLSTGRGEIVSNFVLRSWIGDRRSER